MIIKMPIVCGITAHPSLYRKLDKAIANKDFPIVLDCKNTNFLTSMFHTFAKEVYRRARIAGGTVRFSNMSDTVRDAVTLIGLDTYIARD